MRITWHVSLGDKWRTFVIDPYSVYATTVWKKNAPAWSDKISTEDKHNIVRNLLNIKQRGWPWP
jgi:hypothetical protein